MNLNVLAFIFLFNILCIVIGLLTGHFTLLDITTISITTADLSRAIGNSDFSPLWTFSAERNQRIKFTFRDLHFYYSADYLEIGDGTNSGDTTKLVRYQNNYSPSNVTSVSNSAWLRVSLPSIFRKMAWKCVYLCKL